VISTDFAPEMVEVARRRGAARGLGNVEYRTLDAEQMALDDDCVDAVLCRSGYMLMADPAAALRESRRVLRPGGALAFSVFTTAEENPWFTLPARTFVDRGHVPPPEPGSRGVFSTGDPGRIRELVTGASFADPEIEAIGFAFEHPDEDDVWKAILDLKGPLATAISSLEVEEREAIRNAVIDGFAPYRSADGSYLVPARSWGVLAR
jgi:SAM-dependent methyltransferase